MRHGRKKNKNLFSKVNLDERDFHSSDVGDIITLVHNKWETSEHCRRLRKGNRTLGPRCAVHRAKLPNKPCYQSKDFGECTF